MERHFPAGVTAEAIATAPALTFNQKDRLQHEWVRQAFGQDIAFPTHWLPSTQSFVDASLAGMGWALNPVQLVREHLASGRLVELVAGATLDRPLSWQVNRLAADHLCRPHPARAGDGEARTDLRKHRETGTAAPGGTRLRRTANIAAGFPTNTPGSRACPNVNQGVWSAWAAGSATHQRNGCIN